MGEIKKHVTLYNRVFAALHAEDKFVTTSPLNHEALIDAMARAMRERMKALLPDLPLTYIVYRELAEEALNTIQCTGKE